MKRLIFIFLLIVQAAIILLVAFQYEWIKDNGKPIFLETKTPITTYHANNDVYIEYEINYLPAEIWEIDEELDYREKVFVVLAPDDTGVHRAVRVTKERPELRAEEVSLPATYSYVDSIKDEYRVDYGIEKISQVDPGKDKHRRWLITLKVAPWGQKAITEVAEL